MVMEATAHLAETLHRPRHMAFLGFLGPLGPYRANRRLHVCPLPRLIRGKRLIGSVFLKFLDGLEEFLTSSREQNLVIWPGTRVS